MRVGEISVKIIIKKIITTLTIQTLIIQSLIIISTQKAFANSEKNYPCPSAKYSANTSGFAKYSNFLYSESLKRLDSKYGSNYYPRCLSSVTLPVIDEKSDGMNIAELLMSPKELGVHILQIESETAKISGQEFDASKYNPETLGRQYMMEFNGTGYTNTGNSAIDWKLEYPEMRIANPERYAEFIAIKNKNLAKDGKVSVDKTDYSSSLSASSKTSTENGIAGITQPPTSDTNSQTTKTNDLSSGEIESKAMMSTLTMATIGLLTSRLYTCKMTADMYAAAAAGTAFIAGEIINFKDIKKSLKDLDSQIKNENKEDYQTQIQAFYKLKEGYQEAIKTSQNKTKLQKAAAVAFAGAAVAAGVMYAKNKAMITNCATALSASSKTCAAAFSASCTTGCVTPLQTASTLNATGVAQNATADAKDEIPQLSAKAEASSLASMLAMSKQNAAAASMCPASQASKVACDTAYTFKKNNAGVCPALLTVANVENSNDINLIKLKDFSIPYPSYWQDLNALLFPKAKASSTALLGLGAAAASFVVGTSKVLGPKIDTMLYNPKNRAIIWGVLAGLTYTATSDTEKVIQQLKGRVAVIDGIIKSMENQTGTTTGSGTDNVAQSSGTTTSSSQSSGTTGSTKVLAGQSNKDNANSSDVTFSSKLPCYTKVVNGSCQSALDAMKSTPSFSQLDSATQNQFAKIAQSLAPLNGAAKLSSTALGNLDSLGSGAANALSNLSKDLVKKYKIPQKDADQIEGKKKELLDAVQNQLKKANSSPSRMYASFGGLAPSPEAEKAKASKLEDAKYLSSDSSNFGLGTSSGVGAKGSDPRNFEDVSAKNGEIHVGSNVDEEQMQEIVDFDLNDISKDKEKSIFSIISDRYQKTGYSRLNEKASEKKGLR